jgi:hypothetical protein
VRGDNRAVGVGDKYEFSPAVMPDDGLDFADHDVLFEHRVGYARAYRHDLQCYYANVSVRSFIFSSVQPAKEICIGI